LKELGAELVGEEFLPLGSTVVQPIIEKILTAKPDVILNSINGDSNLPFFAELRKAGITPQSVPTISFSVEEETLRQLDVSAMVGDYAPVPLKNGEPFFMTSTPAGATNGRPGQINNLRELAAPHGTSTEKRYLHNDLAAKSILD